MIFKITAEWDVDVNDEDWSDKLELKLIDILSEFGLNNVRIAND
jgi:hypothetical protein